MEECGGGQTPPRNGGLTCPGRPYQFEPCHKSQDCEGNYYRLTVHRLKLNCRIIYIVKQYDDNNKRDNKDYNINTIDANFVASI